MRAAGEAEMRHHLRTLSWMSDVIAGGWNFFTFFEPQLHSMQVPTH